MESFCKEVKTSSVLLGIEEDTEDRPLFACPVSPDLAGAVEEADGNFTDMRMALLLLRTKDAALVSRVTKQDQRKCRFYPCFFLYC